ncbi:hypothetical protein FRC96_07800 [Lujinxingia vulgaris]|uniref:Uncharacterized protein n=1 Tax=Lujinxingia vulgaris TaxID=2600176 RepID=A0A5C6X818_9DELT|nr:hypothetical protein [Lujinxingia vulgaris]TXD38011.1 hypothetical protein FRC96_07800 [Lujinxingia vulgaris]
MTQLDTGFDAYFYPLEMGGERLYVRDDNWTTSWITVEPGVYAMCEGAEYPSLFSHIVDLMDAEFPGQSWGWSPLGFFVNDVLLSGWGTQLSSDASFRVDAASSTPALTKLLGMDFETRDAFDTGYGWVVSPDEPYGGCWRSLRAPARRPLNTIAEQYVSGGRGQGLHLTRWGADRVRSVTYRNVGAAHVIEGRANIPAYADVANLGNGWTQNQFCDLWDRGISRYQPVYAAYNLTTMPTDISTAARWEVLQSPQGSQFADEFESCISRASRSAEYYDVEFAMRVIGGNDTWG